MKDIVDAITEFRQFFILLSKDQWFITVCNIQELQKLIASCGSSHNEDWEYSISKLAFNDIYLDRHVRPHALPHALKSGYAQSKLLLSVACSCKTRTDEAKIVDPISTLAVKFVVQVDYLEGDESKTSQNSWHLDKHDPTKGTNTSHPLYHYEFGGTEITKSYDFNYGDMLLIDTPRLMHPPLDIVLAIDFIIKHYYKQTDHISLTGNPLYQRYISNARHRVWKPYTVLLASNFQEFGQYEIDSTYAKNIIDCD